MITGVTETAPTQATVAASRATARTGTPHPALRVLPGLGRRLDPSDPAVVRQAASQFVSELFFKPLLAEMRHFPFGQELATGGQTEAVFGEQLDQRLADSVAATDRRLVDEIVRHLDKKTPAPVAGADRANWPAQAQLRSETAGSTP